ncbi:MAG: MASE1 domain-containing protein [Candidatus Competibacter sp.]|nr:MASE1 domain-containing protein [Candidatus Competibacter sp.]MDG4583225.1 MASE1 domain-containing protein [Candidatus Competibacter sp.]
MYQNFSRIVAIVRSISVPIPSRKDFLYLGCVAMIYFFVARLSLSLVLESEGIAAIWPPSGIFLASLLLCRHELRPWLVGVLFVINLVAELLAGTPLHVGFIYALALTGDAVLGAWLLLRFVGEPITFTQVRDVFGFLILAVICSNAIMSLLAATGSMLLPETDFWNSFRWWMISAGIGNLLLTPFIIGWFCQAKTGLNDWKPKRFAEGALLGFVLVFASYISFSHIPENGQFSLLATYFFLPPLMWAALRFGLCGATLALLTLAVFAVRYAVSARGIVVQFYDVQLDALIVTQLYLAVMAVPTLFLTAVMSEYQREERAARENEARLRLAVSASDMGLWDWDLRTNTVYFSPEWKSQIGYRDDEISNHFDE